VRFRLYAEVSFGFALNGDGMGLGREGGEKAHISIDPWNSRFCAWMTGRVIFALSVVYTVKFSG
jgi:hypothetical protein